MTHDQDPSPARQATVELMGRSGDDFYVPSSVEEMDRIQGPVLEDFRRFYDERVDPAPEDRPVYLFFSRGLAHWALKALQFFPPDHPLVLLGAGLAEDEAEWVASRTDRPFFHMDVDADDKVAWELLFAVNRTDFGWIDADCFLLDRDLLEEMARVPEDAALNCIWSHDTGLGVRLPYPHFVFVNRSVLEDPEMTRLGLGPGTYRYPSDEEMRGGRQVPWAVHRILTPEQAEVMDRTLGVAVEDREEPYFNERPFFEPLQAFALAAYDRGYRLNEVRRLGDRRDEDHWNDEIIHVSSVAYVTSPRFPWRELERAPRQRYLMILVADQLLLRDVEDEMPPSYHDLAEERMERLEGILGRATTTEKMKHAARSMMSHVVDDDDVRDDDRWSFLRSAGEAVPA